MRRRVEARRFEYIYLPLTISFTLQTDEEVSALAAAAEEAK